MTAETIEALQVLSKTMDSTTLSPEKIELSTVQRVEDNDEVCKLSELHFGFKPSSAAACVCKQNTFEAGNVKQGECFHPASTWAAVNKVAHSGSLVYYRWCFTYMRMQS